MNKTAFVLLTAFATATALADVSIYRGGGRHNNDIIRVSYRHVPLSDPSDPYHDTYRKNTGEVYRKAPKPIANVHAKQSAAQTDALRYAARAAQAQRSAISVYSNVTARPAPPCAASSAVGTGNAIVINNSNVVINNN